MGGFVEFDSLLLISVPPSVSVGDISSAFAELSDGRRLGFFDSCLN
jgi:hypothetical protein